MDGEKGAISEEIALHRKGSIDRILATPGTERTGSMRGFDPEYVDIVDYIIRCTHRIWEEFGVGLIYTHYQHNSVIHAGNDEVYGSEAVVVDTLKSLAAFPDRKLYGDEVIWTGDDEIGFHTSHHLTTVGHNTGYSAYGPPTGKRVAYRSIANCFVRENRILEEWLLSDTIVLLRQLGHDPNEVAARLARAAAGARWQPSGPLERGVGQLMPETMPPRQTTGFDVEDFVRRSFHEIWNWRLLNKIRDDYAPNYRCRTASGRRFHGRADYAAFVLSLLAAFPDARMAVEQVYWIGNEREGYRVATRWTLAGTHDGPGEWGEPTGARVRVMGLSQHRVEGGVFVAESTLFDEFGLLQQLCAARLAGASSADGGGGRGDGVADDAD